MKGFLIAMSCVAMLCLVLAPTAANAGAQYEDFSTQATASISFGDTVDDGASAERPGGDLFNFSAFAQDVDMGIPASMGKRHELNGDEVACHGVGRAVLRGLRGAGRLLGFGSRGRC